MQVQLIAIALFVSVTKCHGLRLAPKSDTTTDRAIPIIGDSGTPMSSLVLGKVLPNNNNTWVPEKLQTTTVVLNNSNVSSLLPQKEQVTSNTSNTNTSLHLPEVHKLNQSIDSSKPLLVTESKLLLNLNETKNLINQLNATLESRQIEIDNITSIKHREYFITDQLLEEVDALQTRTKQMKLQTAQSLGFLANLAKYFNTFGRRVQQALTGCDSDNLYTNETTLCNTSNGFNDNGLANSSESSNTKIAVFLPVHSFILVVF